MSKVKVAILVFAGLVGPLSFSQTPSPSNAEGAQRLERACTSACHGPTLIAQQRLDRAGWTREVDKMIRWGAQVSSTDKEPLIDYLVRAFNSNRPLPNSFKAVPAGQGADVYQTYCLSCHDDRMIASRNFNRETWTNVVDNMIQLGAFVPASRKTELIDYLTKNFGR